MKKLLALLLALVMVFSLAACGEKDNQQDTKDTTATNDTVDLVPQYVADDSIYDEFVAMVEGKDPSTVKFGFILIGDEEEGYTYAHIAGIQKMCELLGVDYDTQVVLKKNVAEDESCYDAAIELVEAGCNVIFGNSFSFEDYMIQAATEHPEVQFCHATGYQAASSGLDNITNYFVNVYESRYVAGVVAGHKLLEMINNGEVDGTQPIYIGYVGAYSYAEVVSGYTAFYLGVKSVCGDYDVQMKVTYTGSWSSQSLEYDAAASLINNEGCVMVSQHADTTGAPAAAEELGVYCVGYNISMIDTAPTHAIVSATLNWASYYTYAAACAISGVEIPVDWSAGYEVGAVKITEINRAAFGSAETYNAAVTAANDAIEAIIAGELEVFDTSKFTVGGETVSSTADVDGYYGQEYIMTNEAGVSYFAESSLGSAPAFAFRIDGIIELNSEY